MLKKLDNVMWRKSMDYSGVPINCIVQANCSNEQEPNDNNRSKHEGHPLSSLVLQGKESNQHNTGNDYHLTYVDRRSNIVIYNVVKM